MQVLDKGKSTIMSTHVEATDADTGKVICESVVTVVVRGVGGFGGRTKSKCANENYTPCLPANIPPSQYPGHRSPPTTLRNVNQMWSLRRKPCLHRPFCTGMVADARQPDVAFHFANNILISDFIKAVRRPKSLARTSWSPSWWRFRMVLIRPTDLTGCRR